MYNKHEIMINAWSIRRSANVSMSIALKAAWALAKAIKAAEAVAENITWNTNMISHGSLFFILTIVGSFKSSSEVRPASFA